MSDPNQPNPATLHQAFQGFPRLDSPAVDTATGFLTQPWQRLLIRLWQMAGGSLSTLQSSGILTLSPDGSVLTVTNAGSGKAVGTIGLPAPSAATAALAGLLLEMPPEPQRDFSPQLVMEAPSDPQRDFSYLAIMAPPAAPTPDPLLSLALNPLAGLA